MPTGKVSTSLNKDAVWVTKIYPIACLWRSEELDLVNPEKEREAKKDKLGDKPKERRQREGCWAMKPWLNQVGKGWTEKDL